MFDTKSAVYGAYTYGKASLVLERDGAYFKVNVRDETGDIHYVGWITIDELRWLQAKDVTVEILGE